MKIAPQYQTLVTNAVSSIRAHEILSLIGMYDSGKNYLFSLICRACRSLKAENIYQLVFHADDPGSPFTKLLRVMKGDEHADSSPGACEEEVRRQAQHKPVGLLINVMLGAKFNPQFWQMLVGLRSQLGFNLFFVVCANTDLWHTVEISPTHVKKIFERQCIPIDLLNPQDSRVVLHNYEVRYHHPLSRTQKAKIIQLAGGNAGLITGLYLRAKEGLPITLACIDDEKIRYRLEGVYQSLPALSQRSLRKLVQGKRPRSDGTYHFLERFGFVDSSNEVFSPLLAEYIKKHIELSAEVPEQLTLELSRTQRDMLKYLMQHAGQIITREQVAQVLWGDKWPDKYSDWAIDRFISNLRKHIGGYPTAGFIRTKKGEGYLYINKEA
jgi:hypothetical protein